MGLVIGSWVGPKINGLDGPMKWVLWKVLLVGSLETEKFCEKGYRS